MNEYLKFILKYNYRKSPNQLGDSVDFIEYLRI